MVKHIKEWSLSNNLNHNYVYVRNFLGAKLGRMEIYTKRCIH